MLSLGRPTTSPGGDVEAGRSAEARRQRALLAALRDGTPASCPQAAPGATDARLQISGLLATDRAGDRRVQSAGLAVYRAHAGATAERALAAAYPVLRAQVGDAPFAGMARACRSAHPPASGDLGEWGGCVADFIEARAAWPRHPWLADLARLEWAVHQAHRADDPRREDAVAAPQGVAGLDLLAGPGADALQAVMAPGGAVVRLSWPVLALWRAHAVASADAASEEHDEAPVVIVDETALAHAAALLQASQPAEDLWVWRSGWTVQVTEITRGDARWHDALLAGATLASALEAQASALDAFGVGGPEHHDAADALPDFDFTGWLHAAIQQGWLRAFTAVQPCA